LGEIRQIWKEGIGPCPESFRGGTQAIRISRFESLSDPRSPRSANAQAVGFVRPSPKLYKLRGPVIAWSYVHRPDSCESAAVYRRTPH